MAATLKDIANRANVSIRAVTFAIHGEEGVSPRTRERILAIAKELGYRPNLAAQAVSTGRFNCVALLLSSHGLGRSNLPERMLVGIDAALSEHDLHLTIARLPDETLTSEGVVPKILRLWMADGLLVNYSAKIPQKMVELIEQHHLPAVWVNTKRPHDCVHPDDFGAAQAMINHLLQLGHRRIAYVDYSHPLDALATAHFSAQDRLAGCRAAMEAAGLTLQVDMPPQLLNRQQRYEAVRAVLAATDRPTAIITYGEIAAVSTVIAAAELGLKIPQDVQVATFADTPATIGGVEVITARVPHSKQGKAAVEMLLAKIANPSERHPCKAIPFEMP